MNFELPLSSNEVETAKNESVLVQNELADE